MNESKSEKLIAIVLGILIMWFLGGGLVATYILVWLYLYHFIPVTAMWMSVIGYNLAAVLIGWFMLAAERSLEF